MPLINNSIESLYNGVSEQSAEHRQNTQVKEMINAYPSIDKGLLRRNPTRQSYLSSAITYTTDMWMHAYDRGLSGASEEKYAVTITENGMEIIDVNTGDVYKENSGLTYGTGAKQYLLPYTGKNGYSATTVKDTTFIVNKEARPAMATTGAVKSTTQTTAKTIYEATINLGSGYNIGGVVGEPVDFGPSKLAPGILQTSTGCANGYVTFIIDGSSSVRVDSIGVINEYGFAAPRTQSEFKANTAAKLSASLDRTKYNVITLDNGDIKIQKLDGTGVSVSFSIAYKVMADGSTPPVDWQGADSDFVTGITYTNYSGTVTSISNNHENECFIWIKGSNPTAAYTYNVSIIDGNGNAVNHTESAATTTEAAASAIASAINANANYSATATSSIVKVTANSSSGIKTLDVGDSYGNLATFGWINEVQSHTDLPANLGFANSIVKITGSGDSGFSSYWLKYDGAKWVETLNPSVLTELDASNMPHVLIRNSNGTFTLQQYDKWQDRLVGDDDSNPIPSFMGSAENGAPAIRDIFFFKNRLGFMTDRTVVMSEVGNYGNFWRTTAATLLDSDPIDTAVDTTKAIRLEYAAYLEDSVMLFSDKVQFKLEGGKILSPASVQISQTSAYHINKNVRPVYMNDKIFFCAYRGGYTAVMQYQVKSSNTSSEPIDITAHVQSYIPDTVSFLSGDPIHNMVFLSCDSSDTVYVYKYYDVGADRLQSAWFKYTFNGSVYKAFSLGKNLNIFIKRNNSLIAEDWVLGTGTWESAKLWDSSMTWVSLPADLVAQNQFEIMPIAPLDYKTSGFRDVDNSDNSTLIETNVNFGEWVAEFSGKKDIRGILKFKSVMVSSEADSDFELYVNDLHRGDTRIIASKYTVDRKPMVYGDARNIEVGVRSVSNTGFRINTVNYEGSYNSRSTKS